MTLFVLGNIIIKNIIHQNPPTGQWVDVRCLQFRGAGWSPGWGWSRSSQQFSEPPLASSSRDSFRDKGENIEITVYYGFHNQRREVEGKTRGQYFSKKGEKNKNGLIHIPTSI